MNTDDDYRDTPKGCLKYILAAIIITVACLIKCTDKDSDSNIDKDNIIGIESTYR